MPQDSLTEMFTNVTQPDLIVFAAGIGGVLMWLWWYRKGVEKDHFFNIDTDQKRIRLGLYPSGLIAMLAGSAVGFYTNAHGWTANDAALGACVVGMIATWVTKALLNNSYAAVCRIAQSKWFADNVSQVLPLRQPRALPSPPSVGKILSTTTPPIIDVTPQTHTWNEQRALLTEQFIILKQRGAINEAEMVRLHRLLPEVPDLQELQEYTTSLMQQQQNLTIGQKTDLMNIIITQQRKLTEAIEVIDVQQQKLERAGLTMEPQNRIPREVLWATVGAVARHVLGWIL